MCTSPLIRAETNDWYKNKKGGISYKVEWLSRDQWDKNPNKKLQDKSWHGKYRRVQPIPCGQCIECRLNYAREWATRLMLQQQFGYHEIFDEFGEPLDEGKKYPDGTTWFLTLTYKDEYLKTHTVVDTETGEKFEGVSLCKKDFQDFMKRLRKAYPQMKIKYYMCGEYGKQTYRPHYHAIIYGLPLEQEQFKKVGMCEAMKTPRFKLDKLTDIWGLGLVDIGRVTWESCSYVARYTLKKAQKGTDDNWYKAQGKIPEYVAMSNGISKEFFLENKDRIYTTDSVPIPNKKTLGLVKPPRSYDRMLKELDPELYDNIKRKRELQQYSTEISLRQSTDLTPEERRKVSEARMLQIIKDFREEI